MSRTLRVEHNQEAIAILDIQRPDRIYYEDSKPSKMVFKNGDEYTPSCINCMNPRCMRLLSNELVCPSFPEMSHDMNAAVCPVDAISQGANSIIIDNSKCIGCGLCVEKCPIGALYIKDGVATLNPVSSAKAKWMPVTASNIQIQDQFLKKISFPFKTGTMRKESNSVMMAIYRKIESLSQYQQNVLARNLMLIIGGEASLSRQGDVYTRMDGYYATGDQEGVMEIETGFDMLDVSRALLDDVAVLNVRYSIPKSRNHPLAICLSLPNRRTDYWQVLKDIRNVTGIGISTVTFGLLLIVLWSFDTIDDFDQFYIDVDDSSLRDKLESYLERRIRITIGHLGILENSK